MSYDNLEYSKMSYENLEYSKMPYDNLEYSKMPYDNLEYSKMFYWYNSLAVFQDAYDNLEYSRCRRQLGIFQDVVRQLGIPRYLKATWNIEELPLGYHLLFIWCDIIRIKNDN